MNEPAKDLSSSAPRDWPAIGADDPVFALLPSAAAPRLIGSLFRVGGIGGIIVEAEAYEEGDPASHSYRGPTPRNAVMFGPRGRLYVYRSYGIHWCANIVCGPKGAGAAVLLRALLPTDGIAEMAERRGTDHPALLASGPGRLCQALGITGADNGLAFGDGRLELRLAPEPLPSITTPRIGITKAVETPWRFLAHTHARRKR